MVKEIYAAVSEIFFNISLRLSWVCATSHGRKVLYQKVDFSMFFKLKSLGSRCLFLWMRGDKRPSACQYHIFVLLHLCGLLMLFFFFFFKPALVVHNIIHVTGRIHPVYSLFKSTALVCSSILCALAGMGVWHKLLKCYLTVYYSLKQFCGKIKVYF